MAGSLKGRVAVVTGGSYGIGRAIARLLAREGAKVYVGDRQLAEENRGEYAALAIDQWLCDLCDGSQVKAWIDHVIASEGGIDILVNNAGIVLVKQIPETSEAEWDAVMDTNFKAAFLMSKYSLPSMIGRGGGAIVNIASNAGILPRAHDPVYSTSKGALLALTRSLALSHSRDRIRVNAVCPGPVADTCIIEGQLASAKDALVAARQLIEASPLAKAYGRMISSEEVAQAVLYFVSDQARMVTGTSLAIDGGKSLGVPPH